ncbi:helix-turn-helix transcriptional regulator [Desulfovibrio aminophilus]|uniref:helix-turn-helix transcriptional regulator n=1 Tax=Desulfovibrio aminophilus TaxID=81425 RepID=UPI000A0229EB
MDKLLTIEELAELLRTTPRGIRLRRHRGRSLPPALRLGGKLLWRASDISNWLDAEAVRQGINAGAPSAPESASQSPHLRKPGRPRKNGGAS